MASDYCIIDDHEVVHGWVKIDLELILGIGGLVTALMFQLVALWSG